MYKQTLISLRMVAKLPKHVGEIFNLPEDGRYVTEICRRNL